MKGHIRRRYAGAWSVILSGARADTGKQFQKWHTVRGTKKDAERELARLIHEYETGAYVAPVHLTVAEYMNQWLNNSAGMRIATRTFERWSQLVRTHIAPGIGKHKLTSLKPAHLEAFYRELLTSGRLSGKGGLSPRSVLLIHRVLHSAFQRAVRLGMLARNPCDQAEAPRADSKEQRVLNGEQVAALLESLGSSPIYMPVLLAITTGMRRGEICALLWKDVDLERGLLWVNRTFMETAGGLVLKEPKTARSRRQVALPAVAIAALRKHKAAHAELMLQLGQSGIEERFVCAWEDGRPVPPAYVTHRFIKELRRAGLPHVRFHDLRHSYATLLLGAGQDMKIVSEMLGHADIRTTYNIYSHVSEQMQRQAADKLDSVLTNARSPLKP